MKEKVSLQPIEKKSLYIQIADSIYSYIMLNHLQPGDKLPSEREMAGILKTSRNSLREALHVLESKNIIEIRTGSGTFIRDPYDSEGILTVQLHGCSKEDILELQSVLDRQVVIDALRNAEIGQKQELVSRASEMVEMANQKIYSHTLDNSFHTKLYEMSKNIAIRQLVDFIRAYRFDIQAIFDKNDSSVWLPTVKDHLELATAILEENESAAIEAINNINNYGVSLILNN